MNILFLIAPSEWKTPGWTSSSEELSFGYKKPLTIAKNATEKDLKCSGNRYKEAIELNKSVEKWPFLPAIQRYSGVMHKAIRYGDMPVSAQDFFDTHVRILSGMYGLLHPQDSIGNYKLPIETKGLYAFWGEKITKTLQQLQPKVIVDLLPNSYRKMIDFSDLDSEIVRVDFFHKKDGDIKKMTHGVKKYRGEWLKNICEKQITNVSQFGGEIEKGTITTVKITV